MRTVFAFLAVATAQPSQSFSTARYADGAFVTSGSVAPMAASPFLAGSDFPTASTSCPVSCIYDGNIHVQYLLDHPKMPKMTRNNGAEVVQGDYTAEPEDHTAGDNKNKVFHRCYHRGAGGVKPVTGTRECICQCAEWKVDSGAAVCKFHSKTLRDDQCLTRDKPTGY